MAIQEQNQGQSSNIGAENPQETVNELTVDNDYDWENLATDLQLWYDDNGRPDLNTNEDGEFNAADVVHALEEREPKGQEPYPAFIEHEGIEKYRKIEDMFKQLYAKTDIIGPASLREEYGDQQHHGDYATKKIVNNIRDKELADWRTLNEENLQSI